MTMAKFSFAVCRLLVMIGTAALAGCATYGQHQESLARLIETNRQWVAAAAGDNVDNVVSFWTDDATIYAAGRSPIVGKPAIREFITKLRSNPGSSIEWTTDEAVVGHLGYLGYTRGPYELKMPGPDGSLTTQRGHYICIWRRHADEWRCSIEYHTPAP